MSSYLYRALGQAHCARHKSVRKRTSPHIAPGERRHSTRNTHSTILEFQFQLQVTPVKKRQVWWSFCSPHPVLSPSLLWGSLPGEYTHKPITTSSLKQQALIPSSWLLIIIFFPLFPPSQACHTPWDVCNTDRALVALSIQVPVYLSSKPTI